MILIIFIFPLLALIIQVGIVIYAKKTKLHKPKTKVLITNSFKYGFVGAVISLLLTIISMFWYEYSSGYSAGNAPVAWILFYGPLSFSLGQIVALIKWWRNNAI